MADLQVISGNPLNLGFTLSRSLAAQLRAFNGSTAELKALHAVEAPSEALIPHLPSDLQHVLLSLAPKNLHLQGRQLSIASMDPIDPLYLKSLRETAERYQARSVGDFMAWTGVGGRHLHALMPAVLNGPMLQHLKVRLDQVQHYLGLPVVLENTPTPVAFKASEISEPLFINELARVTGASFALNLTTVYQNSLYQDFDPEAYLEQINWAAISQLKISMIGSDAKRTVVRDETSFDRSIWSLFGLAIRLAMTKTKTLPAIFIRDEGSFDLGDVLKWVSTAQLFVKESTRGAQRSSGIPASNSVT